MDPTRIRRGAVLSDDGNYRYHLWREWSEAESMRRLLIVMLNPSDADARIDDPTVRKCIGFSERLGYERFDIANMFGWRSPYPKALRETQDSGRGDIVGPDNKEWLSRLARVATQIVVAWGANAHRWRSYSEVVCRLLLDHHRGDKLYCWGRTSGGYPNHPLMLAYDTPLEEFVPAARASRRDG